MENSIIVLKKIAHNLISPHQHIQLLAEQDLKELLSDIRKEEYNRGYAEGDDDGWSNGYGSGWDDAMREVY